MLYTGFVLCVARKIEAMRKGLLQVVPQAAFELFTWQEVEKRICGDPEITIAALRQNSETILHCTISLTTSRECFLATPLTLKGNALTI